MTKSLTELTQSRQFSVIHADQTSMAQYGLYAASCSESGHRPGTVLDEHNALFQFVHRQARHEGALRSILWKREARSLLKYEANLCKLYDQIITVSDLDKSALLGLFPRDKQDEIEGKISTIPICIEPRNQLLDHKKTEINQILHLGTMFWPPNRDGVLWFAESVFPLVLEQIPDAKFVIAGKEPPSKVQSLAHSNRSRSAQITVTGFVENPEDLVKRSKVFIVPVHAAGGMRVKILMAWKWGIPVVSTTIGAEGIEIVNGHNILIADDPQDFYQAVVAIIRDSNLANRLIRNGRFQLESKYDWKEIYKNLDVIYEQFC